MRGTVEEMGGSGGASNVLSVMASASLHIHSSAVPRLFLFFVSFFGAPFAFFAIFLSPPSNGLSHVFFHLSLSLCLFFIFSPSPHPPPSTTPPHHTHTPHPPRSLSPCLFRRSLKGGHEGDNANTGPLNREWEEDSCWR